MCAWQRVSGFARERAARDGEGAPARRRLARDRDVLVARGQTGRLLRERTRLAHGSRKGVRSMTLKPGLGDDTPLSDQSERDAAAQDFDRCLSVEASAGTGKTALIVERVANLIGSGRAGLLEMAVITFTEKAASELEERIRAEIDRRIVAGGSVAAVERYMAARADLDRAAIQTIHGFAASLLRRRPVEGGVDPRFRVLDPQAQEVLFDETWDRFVAEEARQPGNALLETLLTAGVRLVALHALASRFVEHRDLARAGAPGRSAAPDARAHALELCRWMTPRVEAVRSSCLDPKDRLFGRLVQACEASASIAELPPENAERAMRTGLTPIPKNVGSESRWRRDGIAQARQLRDDWNDRILAFAHERGAHLEGEAAAWMERFLRAYEARKARDGVLDFQDLLLRARDLLASPRTADDLGSLYAWILVDELQDTDPLQLEIVASLASRDGDGSGREPLRGPSLAPRAGEEPRDAPRRRPRGASLFLVGDPKQSIYRFRRADASLYAKATGWLESATDRPSRLRITDNFRSRPEIAVWVNALFERVLGREETGSVYAPIAARRPASSGPAVLYLVPEAASPSRGIPSRSAPGKIPAAEARALEATAIARLIRESLREERWRVGTGRDTGERPARGGDIAVLLRAFGDVELYEDALRDAGLACMTSGGKRYFLRPEVAWFSALLRAIECPHDEVAVVAALRSPFFGVSDEEILMARVERNRLDPLRPGGADDGAGLALRTLGAWHRTRNESPVGAAVRTMLEESGGLLLAALRPQGEQMALNLLKVADLARKHETEGGGFRSFVRWLGRAGRVELEESDSPVLDGEEDAVRMMTIHAAKGLEFPVVIVGDLARKTPAAETFLIDHDDHTIRFALKGIDVRSEGYERLRDREKVLQRQERRRLLYVAVTRARDLLVLPVPADTSEESFARDLTDGGALTESLLWGRSAAAAAPSPSLGDERAGPGEDRGARPAAPMPLPNGALVHIVSLGVLEETVPGLAPEPGELMGARAAGQGEGASASGWSHPSAPAGSVPPPAARDGSADRSSGERSASGPLEAWETRRAALLARAAAGPTFLAASRASERNLDENLAAAGSARAAIDSDVAGRVFAGIGAAASPGNVRASGTPRARLANRERAAKRARVFGLAVHAVLEDVDLSGAAAVASLAAAHAALQGCPERTREVAEAARRALGMRAVREASSRRVLREVPVALLEGDTLVEGQIDLVYEAEDGSLVVVDFKTDDVCDAEEAAARAADYRPQVALYAAALERATGRAVRETALLFLAPGLEVRLPHDSGSRALAAAAIAQAAGGRNVG